MTGKETSTSASRGGHTTGTAQDEGELELREAGVQQEDTVLAEAATPGDRLARLSGCPPIKHEGLCLKMGTFQAMPVLALLSTS